MKMTNHELQAVTEGLSGIANMSLKASCAFKVRLIIKKIKDYTVAFDEVRGELADKYCAKDEDGKFVTNGQQYTFASTDDENAFRDEVAALLNQEIDVDIAALKAEDFGDTEIAPNVLMRLDSILED